jgi:hypothetical protein
MPSQISILTGGRSRLRQISKPKSRQLKNSSILSQRSQRPSEGAPRTAELRAIKVLDYPAQPIKHANKPSANEFLSSAGSSASAHTSASIPSDAGSSICCGDLHGRILVFDFRGLKGKGNAKIGDVCQRQE